MTDLPLTSLQGATQPGLRTETPEQRATAKSALAFERLLLGELTKTLADPKLVSGGGETSGATSMLLSQMPDILADALSEGGGIGLAAALQPALEGRAR